MNSIPSIFNERKISYTIVKGNHELPEIKMPVTCILLCHGINQFKQIVYKNLLDKGFAQIISVERKTLVNNVEEISNQFPQIKFIVPLEDDISEGDMLNIAMSESEFKNVLVLQEEQCTQNFVFTSLMAKKLIDKNVFCVCPKLVSANYDSMSVCFKPSMKKSKFQIEEIQNYNDGDKTLYSADLSGFYNLDKYIQLGGIDYTIKSEYWQKLDLFLRAWLWGEETIISSSLVLRYGESVINYNKTPDETYMRFYLKNLLPVFKTDHAYIPLKSFIAFNFRSPYSFSDTVFLFNDARKWTSKNQYRFKTDAATLIQNWEK